jgi:hypothetical protein
MTQHGWSQGSYRGQHGKLTIPTGLRCLRAIEEVQSVGEVRSVVLIFDDRPEPAGTGFPNVDNVSFHAPSFVCLSDWNLLETKKAPESVFSRSQRQDEEAPKMNGKLDD